MHRLGLERVLSTKRSALRFFLSAFPTLEVYHGELSAELRAGRDVFLYRDLNDCLWCARAVGYKGAITVRRTAPNGWVSFGGIR